MAKKSSVLRQERRQTGGGEVPKEAELTDFEMRFLEEPILTLPFSTPLTATVRISKFQNLNTPVHQLCLLTSCDFPTQNTEKITEYDSSSDPSNAVMDMNDLNSTPKIARPLEGDISYVPKTCQNTNSSSAAARAAACIEEEHRMKIKYMEMNEERKK
ncbi:hypothetical protein TNCV_3350621 [Trichonephila clavipes]|nr:hypothetical protein TNCV_3350621 [Trichonephila clavipes]